MQTRRTGQNDDIPKPGQLGPIEQDADQEEQEDHKDKVKHIFLDPKSEIMPSFLGDQVSKSSGTLSAGKTKKGVKNMGTVLVVEALNHMTLTCQSQPTTSAFEPSVRSSNLGLANSEFAPKCTTSGNAPSNKRPQITCTKGAQRWLGKIARRVPLVASNAKSSPHAWMCIFMLCIPRTIEFLSNCR